MFTKNLKKKKNNALMSNQQLLRIGSESKKNTYQRQIYRRYSVNVPAWMNGADTRTTRFPAAINRSRYDVPLNSDL